MRASKPLSGMRILLVDDDAALRRAIARFLASEGAAVFEASDGVEALDQARRETGFHVALLDVEMPPMRGTELACALRELSDECPIARLIGMSGSARAAEAERSLFDEFLSKPLSPEDILALIRARTEQ